MKIPNTIASFQLTSYIFSAGFLSGLFNQLLRPQNRHILEKLKTEIRQAFENEDQICYEELLKINYLTAVIEEGLRIFPSAPIPFVRTVPKGGDTVVGEFIPGGVSLRTSQTTNH
jgi:cytochrome P450